MANIGVLKIMNLKKLNSTKQRLDAQLQQLVMQINQLPTASCRTCTHFSFECSLCGEMPPDEVLDSGCDEWVYDGVPVTHGSLTADKALSVGGE
jgi:hypothetical protein